MILNDKNQNDINTELLNSYEFEYIFSNKPINRTDIKPKKTEKTQLLLKLKEKLKDKLVFSVKQAYEKFSDITDFHFFNCYI